jgi:hypothetical protein
MAGHLGLEYQAYYQYEKGKRKIPQDVLNKLALKGLNLNWLATGEGPMLRQATFEELLNAEVAGNIQGASKLSATFHAGPTAQAMDYGAEAARVVLTALRREGWEGKKPDVEEWLIQSFADGLAAGRSRQLLEARLALAIESIRANMQEKAAE